MIVNIREEEEEEERGRGREREADRHIDRERHKTVFSYLKLRKLTHLIEVFLIIHFYSIHLPYLILYHQMYVSFYLHHSLFQFRSHYLHYLYIFKDTLVKNFIKHFIYNFYSYHKLITFPLIITLSLLPPISKIKYYDTNIILL